MDVDDEGLSPEERSLATELARLAPGPTAQSRAAILQAIHGSQPAGHSFFGPRRLGLAAAAALILLVGSSIGVFAGSAGALPNSPGYTARTLGEQCRIAVATPTERERLRISFAEARTAQARVTLGHGDRAEAAELLRDSRRYLQQTKDGLGSLPADRQGQIENQLHQAEANEQQAESQLNQDETQRNNSNE